MLFHLFRVYCLQHAHEKFLFLFLKKSTLPLRALPPPPSAQPTPARFYLSPIYHRLDTKLVFQNLICPSRPGGTVGQLGVSTCPGLRNTRPSRADGCPQRSLEDDIRTIAAEQVSDVLVISTDYEIKHYCGVSNEDYLQLLKQYGLTPTQYAVQDMRPPSLEVRDRGTIL